MNREIEENVKGLRNVSLPIKAQVLFKPYRYKVLVGGRGGGKSHSIATALLVFGMEEPQRILCAREFQNSIRDSVHKLLSDKIVSLGLESFYTVDQTSIKGINGTEFFFEGIKSNVNKIKSYQGIKKVWIEEANLVSKQSWEILIPTIRAENSEIWISFNPELEDDETYQRFIINPPKNSIVIEMNWRDNPWFPEVLKQEMEELKARDEKAYQTVWEGKCRKVVDGSIFAQEIEAAEKGNRITTVPYNKNYPVITAWDLGWSDFTSIWFCQQIGEQVNVIDFYQAHLQEISHFVKVLQDRNYVYEFDLVPHDAKKTELGTGKTIEEVLRRLGRNTRVVPMLSKKDQIDSARRLFSVAVFDAERCKEGLNALRRYRYAFNDSTGMYSREPLHDMSSHACCHEDTIITTINGDKKIKDVMVGDKVKIGTLIGRVSQAGKVKDSVTLTITFRNGTSITTTNDHKFFTTRGVVYADDLRYNDHIFNDKSLWLINYQEKLSRGLRDVFIENIKGLNIGCGPTGNYSVLRSVINKFIFIKFFGRISVASWRKVKNYLLKTEIGRTLNQTIGVLDEKELIEISQPNTRFKSLMEDATLSVVTMDITPTNKIKHLCIGLFGRHIMEKFQKIFTFITKITIDLITRLKIWTLLVSANMQGFMQRPVSGLGRQLINYRLLKSRENLDFCVVEKVSNNLEKSAVYDLTVEKHHCYIANGVLVSNSDAFSYMSVGLPDNPNGRVLKLNPRLRQQIQRSRHNAVLR